jgi:predicted DNA-binding transcriptional regulator YafY
MSTAKTARWLDLLAYLLQHRFPVTREDIYTHVHGYADGDDAARRQRFERDKRELKEQGIEIETVTLPRRLQEGDEPVAGYRLAPAGAYLPYLELTDAPASAADKPYRNLATVPLTKHELAILDRATRRLAQLGDSPLAEAAASARRKLSFDLPLDPDTVERVLALPLTEKGRRALAILQQAVAERFPVRCRYYSIHRDEESERIIEPYGIMFQGGHWYLVGHPRDRDDVRIFRVDRCRDVALLPNEPRCEPPPGFDIRRYLGRAAWDLGADPPVTVTARFEFPEWRWVAAQRLGTLVDAPDDPAATEATLEFAVRDRAAFLRWALGFGKRIEIRAPVDLAEALGSLRQAVAAKYAEVER